MQILRSQSHEDGSTLLHWAAEEDNVGIVNLLLQLDPSEFAAPGKNSVASIKDNALGMTPLHAAAMMGSSRVLSSLLLHQVDQYEIDNSGWNAFMYALYREQVSCVLLLLGLSHTVDSEEPNGCENMHFLSEDATERAYWHLAQLGTKISSHKDDLCDEKLNIVFEALATVPEFFRIINSVVHRYHCTALEESLHFVYAHPYMLNTSNRLNMGLKMLLSDNPNHPMLSATGYTNIYIELRRQRSWGDFVETISTKEGFSLNSKIIDDCIYNDLLKLSPLRRAIHIMTSKVMFNFKGIGESGCGVGVEKELFEDICKCLVRKNRTVEDNYLNFNVPVCGAPLLMTTNSYQITDDDILNPVPFTDISSQPSTIEKTCFMSFGMLIGHIILRRIASSAEDISIGSVNLPLNISNLFWRIVLRKKITIEDIADADAIMYKSLVYIRDSDHVENLCLTFSAAKNSFNAAKIREDKSNEVVDLIEGGKNIQVNDENKFEYIDTMVAHLTKRIRRQADLTREGLEQCVPRDILSLYSERELAFIIAGNPRFNVQEWRNACVLHNAECADDVILWFWKFVEELSQTERGLLFRFATGSSRLSAGGFDSIQPKFTITISDFDQSRCLPTAATCFNHLKLPRYPSEGMLKKSMHIAILHGNEGFTMV